MSFYVFIFIAQAMYFSVYQHMCARPQAQMCYSFYTTVHSNTVFHSVNESVFEQIEWASDSTVHSDGLTCFVSFESTVLKESFDLNVSVSHLFKQGLAATYWWFYCHIYLSMTDLNQPRCQHKNTFIFKYFLLSILTKIPLFQAPEGKKNL